MSTTHDTVSLFEALTASCSTSEMENFLIDLCTPQEIKVLKERWRVCQLLDQGTYSYRDIHKMTGASLTTIGRVARYLNDERSQGYRMMLKKFKNTA